VKIHSRTNFTEYQSQIEEFVTDMLNYRKLTLLIFSTKRGDSVDTENSLKIIGFFNPVRAMC
jgi:hypothetical protein